MIGHRTMGIRQWTWVSEHGAMGVEQLVRDVWQYPSMDNVHEIIA